MTSSSGLGPAIPRRRLGAELKRLRDERNKTLADVASDLLISTSKLSRLEKGQAPPSERDVRDLLAYFGETDSDLGERMRAWAQEGREAPWWQREDAEFVPSVTGAYLRYETAAETVSGYIEHFVPSLLQTEQYARGLIAALNSEEPERWEALVRLRLRRQEVIRRRDFPMRLDVVLDESVLHRMVGSPQVMRDQLGALADSAELPTVTLRVLRFSAGPHPAMGQGTFTIFHFRRPIDPDVVNIEGTVTDSYIEQQDRVAVYRRLIDDLRQTALDPDASVDLIRQMSGSY